MQTIEHEYYDYTIEDYVQGISPYFDSGAIALIFSQDADTLKRGYLDFEQFQKFAKVLKRRPDIEGIYAKLCTANGGKFELDAFIKFMKEYQKVKPLSIYLLLFNTELTQ